jgi:hypothetical protein
MGTLKTSPDIAVAGTKFTITGTGLPANKAVTITWGTAKVTWVVDARPDSVDYLGRQADKLTVVLAQTATDATGKFVVALKAPADFGGIHDLYAVVDGVQVAKGGFLIDRSATISPKSGPIGTMLTVTYTGLGSSLYEGGASLLYDNKYAGAMMANWTRGVAVAHIRASGPVGRHTIEAADAISFKYLNIQQSPIPWGTGYLLSFNVTKDNGRRRPASTGRPTSRDARCEDDAAAGLRVDRHGRDRAARLYAGAVNSQVAITASGLVPNTPVDLEWGTVVGNRVNCTGTCWAFVSVPLGTPTTDG